MIITCRKCSCWATAASSFDAANLTYSRLVQQLYNRWNYLPIFSGLYSPRITSFTIRMNTDHYYPWKHMGISGAAVLCTIAPRALSVSCDMTGRIKWNKRAQYPAQLDQLHYTLGGIRVSPPTGCCIFFIQCTYSVIPTFLTAQRHRCKWGNSIPTNG